MRGLMMDFPLSIPAMVRRGETLFGHKHVVSRRPDRSIVRHSYLEIFDRVRRLGAALQALGVQPGDRVATLGWAGHEHLEAYLAIPSIGAVLHTLNLRLHHDDLIYIANDADDKVVIVDESLLELWERVRPHVHVKHVIVMAKTGATPADPPFSTGVDSSFLDYEEVLAASKPDKFRAPDIDEGQAAAMCYTSGTTGRPKGVLYSHRSMTLHTMAAGLRDCIGLAEDDTVLPIVPMFHVNAWGLPFGCVFYGANQVFAGPFMDAKSVLELIVNEKVTVTGGVPTVWLGVLNELDANPGKYDLGHLRVILVGGSAAPISMIKAFQEKYHVPIMHAWGMTEMSPIGTLGTLPSSLRTAPADAQYAHRAKQGIPVPLVEIRGRSEKGLIPWDGQTMGELEVRGPWVASAYFNVPGPDDRFTEDGWFKTGDIVTIAKDGCIEIADRSKDLVKSGGEWISSVALESALMCHPAVAEAAVIAVPHPKWDERPLAAVVLKPGHKATAEELTEFLAPNFAKWWLPDVIEFVGEIPRTSVGKFKKSALREQFKERYQTA